jgi:iron complex transport system ATP-binding protein
MSSNEQTEPGSEHRAAASRLSVDAITVGYGARTISSNLSVTIPNASFTAIIGPNACGKSTLLRTISRILLPTTGAVLLDGRSVRDLPSKEIARRMGLLPQTAIAPDGITVADLVARGRFPHQSLIRQWRPEDERAVAEALAATRVSDLSGRLVDELSGGQRQRVWVAMLLAQQTPIMLLDEPTTFLDIAHQYELLELLRDFHDDGRTLVAVLHDLGQACRYASHLIVMKDGQVVTTGAPSDVMTAELVNDVFGMHALVVPDPVTGTPSVFPLDPRASR